LTRPFWNINAPAPHSGARRPEMMQEHARVRHVSPPNHHGHGTQYTVHGSYD